MERSGTHSDQSVAELREAVSPGRVAPADFAAYPDKVRQCAYSTTDDDVTSPLRAGYSEDEILERTVSVAVDAGLERLEAAPKAVL